MEYFRQPVVISLEFLTLMLSAATVPAGNPSDELGIGNAETLDSHESPQGQQPLIPDLLAQPPPSLLGPGEDITIQVLDLTGKRESLQVNTLDTIQSVKEKIQQLFKVPVDKQRLAFEGKQLEDGRTLADYDVQNGSVIHLIVRE